MTGHDIEAALARADGFAAESEARLAAFLRIPSVSAQPAHAADCRAAAAWAERELAELGFEVALHETAGHPIVLAHHPGPRGGRAPHLLYYGHYDVQPAEPLGPWSSPPFEPHFVEGPVGRRVVARGAVDDKGQVMTWLEAFRAWTEAGGLPAPVTVLLEGEEEVGSVNLEAFLGAQRERLAADVAVISDTGMWDIDTPAVTTMLRGLVYAELRVRGAARDLHSGMYGGAALNPAEEVARLLAGLHDAEGRVSLPGFYDGVRPLAAAQAAAWDGLGFDEAAFLRGIGLAEPGGERGLPALQRLWARPTAEVNGLWGGYAGPGPKTVIAAEAGAKVSFRLVAGQDPKAVGAGFAEAMTERARPGFHVEVALLSADPGIELPADSRWVRQAQRALTAEYGRPAVLIGCGGSIPVVESLHRVLGLPSLLVGFGLEDDQVHGPNEKFELRCLRQGIRSHVRLLAELAG